jgi:hypothetical protein
MRYQDLVTIVQSKDRVLIVFYKWKAKMNLANFLRTKGKIQIESVFPADTHNTLSISRLKIGQHLDQDCSKVSIFPI